MSNHVQHGIFATILSSLLVGIILLAIEKQWFSTIQPSPGPTPEPPTREATNSSKEAKLTLSTSVVRPGTALIVYGRGFAAGETVVIRFNGMRELKSTPADGNGKFETGVQIPEDQELKMAFIEAEGLTSGRRDFKPFQVLVTSDR